MTDPEDRPIGTAKAAEILGWSTRKVQRAAATGAIPIVGKLDGRDALMFSQQTIEEIAAREGETPAP